ncbi:JmjC domain [Trinorchestia longiramus]|nr:JmjC domain [Trinorchestia longiramus]
MLHPSLHCFVLRPPPSPVHRLQAHCTLSLPAVVRRSLTPTTVLSHHTTRRATLDLNSLYCYLARPGSRSKSRRRRELERRTEEGGAIDCRSHITANEKGSVEGNALSTAGCRGRLAARLTFSSPAIKSFQQVLYIDSSFSRANEVHLRLGLMLKVQNDFEGALKHFQLALLDSGPCSFTKLEIRFHEAHLYELQGKHKVSQDAYEKLLKEESVSGQLRADILRQLGWMYHTVTSLGDKREREEKAVSLLQKSIEADPKSGQSLYLLGRCLASLGRIHDAFVAYRNSVDKCEGNADTWCSIGVLYQQQNQPVDALQAYICAVQFDKSHVAAWTNLGILYESCNQPRDALTCYLNASRTKSSRIQNPNLGPRTRFLQQQLAAAPMPSLARPKTLFTIEEAWNLPIATDMNQRGGSARNSSASASGGAFNKQPSQHPPPPPYQQHQDAKRFKPDAPEQPRPQFYLNSHQVQMLHYLQNNQSSLTPPQQQQLQHLQHNYRLMQQHQMQVRQQQQQQLQQSPNIAGGQNYGSARGQQGGFASPLGSAVNGSSPVAASGPGYLSPRPPTPQQYHNNTNNYNNSTYTGGHQQQQQPAGQQMVPGGQPPAGSSPNFFSNHDQSNNLTRGAPTSASSALPDPTTVSDQELQELISQKEFAESFAEDLLNRLAKGENVMDELNKGGELDQTALPNTQFSSGGLQDTGTQRLDARNVKQEVDLKPDSVIGNGEHENLPSGIKLENNPEVEIKSTMLASEILTACRGRGTQSRNFSMLGDNQPPPSPPDPPATRLNQDQLVPPTASVLLENKKLAFSPQLQEFCLKHPIAVVRGIASALKMDLGLFSTKTLVETNPDHTIEVRTQAFQPADKNLDPNNPERVVWPCYSHRSHTTIAKYAQYQANTFQESLKEEQDRIAAGGQRVDDSKTKKKVVNKMIKFGTNVDLSDDKKWRAQLQELQKLPSFTRVVSAGNMLSHVGHPILGMNTVQLYMKVPGSRTPGHQENNNFCSININIGPGDCEWFAVPDAYWGVIANLCEKNGTNYLHGSWWPDLKELFDENVPVYRFLQKPGDMVWVNSGCVHWVQAVGWCNNIAWNVGPLTARQYSLGLERYEWNKLQRFKSIVPMLHLTWNLARNIKVSDTKFFELIKTCLMRSLKQVFLTLDFVRMCGIEPRFHGRARNEASHYCGVCEIEVFNILMVRDINGRNVVHCIDCARRISPTLDGFIVLEEYHLEDIMEVYDQFVLHSIQSQSIPGQAPTPPPSSLTPTPSAVAT